MNILITGGAGFIGSNLIRYMYETTDHNLVNLDLLTYAGNLDNLRDIEESERYHFIHGDIRDRNLLEKLFETYKFDTVINLAAESHVDNSIEDPEIFLSTNILGTQALLDTAKDHWKVDRENKKSDLFYEGVKFIQVSTDEVYGTLGKEGLFTEETPLAPNSPYSASKASADMIVRAYHETYGLPVNITRCSNNYGPYQFPEKLIPLMINNTRNDKKLPVYGDGKQVRDWLHVTDHCRAIKTVMDEGANGEIYNIGGNNEKQNIEIVKIVLKKMQKDESLINYVDDRLGHDRRYAIDNYKITSELNWEPAFTFDQGIENTINWYLSNSNWMGNTIRR